MFDIGWTELLVIGVVALIVVGPKDLPIMFHKLGQFTAKARGMAREFQRAMDDAAKEAGVSDVSRDLRKMTSPSKLGLDRLKDATRDLASVEPKRGPATQKLSEERAEKAAKVREATARAATDRKAAEAAKAAEALEPVKSAAGSADAVDRADTGAGAKTDG
jgi:sec-independent protein translocase protein TatB